MSDQTVAGEVARVETAHAMLTGRLGWCFPCLDDNHDACVAMTYLPETGHLCECPWQPWSAERREYR